MSYFLEGLVIGLAIAAPVGPIGVLCIQRSLQKGFKIGFMTGMGAACADAVYGIFAAFGITAITSLLVTHQFWIRLIGGFFLIYLGIKTLMSSPQSMISKESEKSLWKAYNSTFFLTLTNPTTILSFLAIFAGMELNSTNNNYVYASVLVLGILVGSALWWLLLSGAVAFVLRKNLNSTITQSINLVSGVIIIMFGIFVIKCK